jgi:capsular polysaccharide biosynthesis protein
MRILFYIEPFPIRNKMTSYAWLMPIAYRLAWERSFTKNSPEFRVFANRQSFEAAEALPDGCAIDPSDREQRFFEDFLVDWESQGIENWVGLMSGQANFLPAYIDVINSIHSRFPFDVIVHWGDNGAIEAFCRSSGIERIAVELGCSRPPYMKSLCFDPLGVNGSSSPSRVSIFDLEPLLDIGEMNHADLLAQGREDFSASYEQSFAYIPDKLSKMVSAGDKPVAFLPLQLHDDANLLRYSSFESPVDFLRTYLSRLTEAGYSVIVKPHPHWLERPGGLAAKKCAYEVTQSFGSDAIWYEGGLPNPFLLAQSDLVVTINSSIGFEALLHNKTVILAGDAMYKPRDVFPTLEDFLRGGFDRAVYLHKISVLKEIFLNGYLAPSARTWHWQGLIARLQCIVEATRCPQASSLAVIKALYVRFAKEQEAYRYAPWLERLGEV